MRDFIQSLARDESGVTAVEYAILAGVVVAIIAGAGAAFSDGLGGLFGALTTKMGTIADGINK